jgi:hypothetical protein
MRFTWTPLRSHLCADCANVGDLRAARGAVRRCATDAAKRRGATHHDHLPLAARRHLRQHRAHEPRKGIDEMGEHRSPLVVTDLGSGRRRRRAGQVRDEHVDVPGRADELLGSTGLGQRLLARGDVSPVFQKTLDECRAHEVVRLGDEHSPPHEAFA